MSLIENNVDHNEPVIDPNKNYYEELVGENGKYKTPEDLARSKIHADVTIAARERALDELRQDYIKLKADMDARANLEELAKTLAAASQTHASSDTNLNANDGNTQMPTYNPDEVKSLISSSIQEHEMNKRQNDNFNTVENKLKETYGANYKQVLKQQMDELGLSEDFVNNLAKSNPKAFFRTFDVERRTEGFQTPPQNVRRPDGFVPRADGQHKTWSYYQEMRKTKPSVYFDPKTQVQMQKDAIALGPKFQDGDWNAI